MILRPFGIVRNGRVEVGQEVVLINSAVAEIRPVTGAAEPWILSPAFVNVHSHLEYRGMLGKIHGDDFPSWIRAITIAKGAQDLEEVRRDCHLAAQENRVTGVAMIGEHSDRPFSREAMDANGLDGPIFQELITFNEKDGAAARWQAVTEKAAAQRAAVSPHAPYTVDRESLIKVGQTDQFLSIHACESDAERSLFLDGTGAFAAMFERFEVPLPTSGQSPIQYLDDVGFLRPARQLVHCCAVDDADLDLMAKRGVSVAHCPRSNAALGCPPAPVAQMLAKGINVGLGLDSCASSGPIDMFAEMRSAQETALKREETLDAETIWQMATSMGAASLWREGWDIKSGFKTPLIRLDIPGARTTQDLIDLGRPEAVSWITQIV